MFQKIKNAMHQVTNIIKQSLFRIYLAVAVAYISSLIIAAAVASIIFPPLAPVAIGAALGLIALGFAAHYFTLRMFNTLSRYLNSETQQTSQAKPKASSSSTQHINQALHTNTPEVRSAAGHMPHAVPVTTNPVPTANNARPASPKDRLFCPQAQAEVIPIATAPSPV